MTNNLVSRCCTIHADVLYGMLCAPVCEAHSKRHGNIDTIYIFALFIYVLWLVRNVVFLIGTTDTVASNGPFAEEINPVRSEGTSPAYDCWGT